MSKIIGITVGTTMSSSKIKDTLKPVSVKPQDLTPEEQAQARANIGAAGVDEDYNTLDTTDDELGNVTLYGKAVSITDVDGAADYYSTTREELAVTLGKEDAVPNDVTSECIWGLYDALMAKYPDRVQKLVWKDADKEWSAEWEGYEPAEGTFVNWEYVISTGEYNTEGAYTKWWGDKDVKKPKYLLLSGIHGDEEPAIISAYRFIRDVLEGHNIPAQFREGCVIHIVPVGNPYGLNNHIRNNENGVDINRNFDWNWGENVTEGKNPGPSAASEKETQAIANWLLANQDAKMFFDCHNQGAALNEVAWFVGLDDNRSKEIALQGVGCVIPFWRDVIGYTDGTVYPISVTIDEGGIATNYAYKALNIPSLTFEMSSLQNDSQEGIVVNDVITIETVSAGAEVIGNVLIEFYEYALNGEVIDMTETNEKLDALAESVNSLSKGFSIKSGTLIVEEDVGSSAEPYTVVIPCPAGAKVVTLIPDNTTRAVITSMPKPTTESYSKWFLGFHGQVLNKFPWGSTNSKYDRYRGILAQMELISGNWIPYDCGTTCNNNESYLEDGFSFVCMGIKAGTYNWTAYYWND